MVYNKVENEFKDRAVDISPGGALMLSYADTINFLERCLTENIGILGIDAFHIFKPYVQPDMEYSIDISLLHVTDPQGSIQLGLDFMRKAKSQLYYEVVCME